jgi:hypothetical protein
MAADKVQLLPGLALGVLQGHDLLTQLLVRLLCLQPTYQSAVCQHTPDTS